MTFPPEGLVVDGRGLSGHPLVAEVVESYRAATQDPRLRVEVT